MIFDGGEIMSELEVDRPHLRDYSTHKQTPWTDNDPSLLFAALGTDGCYQVHCLSASLSYAIDKNGLLATRL